MIVGTLAKLFEHRPQGLKLGAKACPISGFQPFNGAVIVRKGLVGPQVNKTDRIGGVRTRSWREIFKKRGQRSGKGLLHDDPVAIGRYDPLKLRPLTRLRPKVKRRNIENGAIDRNHQQSSANNPRCCDEKECGSRP